MERQIKYMLWRLMGRLFGRKSLPGDSQSRSQGGWNSILVIRHDRLGDVLLSTPVYESIKRSFPGCRVAVLARPGSVEVLKGNPHIDRVILYRPENPLAMWRDLRMEPFDLAIVLNQMFSGTASALALASGASWRAGYARPEGAGVFNIAVPVPAEVQHEVRNNLDVLRYLEFPEIRESPAVFFDAAIEQKIDGLLGQNRRLPDRPLILVKPGTRLAKWGWALDKFRELCRLLLAENRAEVFLICGPGEEAMNSELIRGMNPAPKSMPPMGIRELACLIRRADLLVCNHTGIMHLASAVKTPVAAIFKHGDAKRWGPFGVPFTILDERGSQELSPETALAAVMDLLGKTFDPRDPARQQGTR